MHRSFTLSVIACLIFLLFLTQVFAGQAKPIHLKSGTIYSQASPVSASEIGEFAGRHVLVQFDDALTASQRMTANQAGLTLLSPIPDNAWLAFVPTGAPKKSTFTTGRILFLRELTPKEKMHPRVFAGDFDPHMLQSDGRGLFEMSCHKDVSLVACASALRKSGAEIIGEIQGRNTFFALAYPALLEKTAAIDAIAHITQPTPAFGLFNATARVTIGADVVYEPPYSVNGAGVKVLVYDGGVVLNNGADAMHPDLKGRLAQVESRPMDIISHATHVSCSIAGTGFASGGINAGMAPGVETILSAAYSPAHASGIFYNDPGDMRRVYQTSIEGGAVLANNSIGANVASNGFSCDWEGDYEGSAAMIDEIVSGKHGGDVIVLWANGNERGNGRCGTEYGTTPPPLGAKNTIAVGAVNKEDASMTSFSSWGPMDDGRLKPDIVAPGGSIETGGIRSCTWLNFYISMSGTSMASPIATGGVALLLDYWQQNVSPELPSAALVKAMVIHSAQDLGQPGPDYQNGYGLLSVPDALDLIAFNQYMEISLDQNQNFQINLDADGSQPIKATLVWADPAADPTAAKALVNDLDLSLENEAGESYLPFVLDPAHPERDATTGVDAVNPVEQVLIEASEAGYYSLTIAGTQVPEGPQNAALVVTGASFWAAEEICTNDIDDTCDGQINEGCDETDDDDSDDDNGSDDDDDDEGCCG